MATFAELEIPFPLFEAPIEDAYNYCGMRRCSLCGKTGQHCFRLGIGCAILLECQCGTLNGLDADDREDIPCRKCKALIRFPGLNDEEIAACYSCLRAGKAAITQDTELGMISWEQASEGVTHGVPGLSVSDFEMVPKEDDWIGARLPSEMMFELLRTPTYNSIQGERWQFCCKGPMIFIGEWSREDFDERAPEGSGRQFFEQIVQDPIPGLWEDTLHDITGIYVFRCSKCDRLTAHWDIA